MAHITFIHGISAMPEESELHLSWLKSLAYNEGIDLGAEGMTANFVYWSDLMHKSVSSVAGSFESIEDDTEANDAFEEPDEWKADLPANEKAFLEKLESKIESIPAGPSVSTESEFERIPLPFLWKKKIMGSFLRDVHHFLFNKIPLFPGMEADGLRDIIRRRVIAALKEGRAKAGNSPLIVIAHSLGSVIIYDALRRANGVPAIDGLLTCGSPLGVFEIQAELMEVTDTGRHGWSREDGYPDDRLGEGGWRNVYHLGDPVAADPNISNDYMRDGQKVIIDDLQYLFHWNTHSSLNYLKGKDFRRNLKELLQLDTRRSFFDTFETAKVLEDEIGPMIPARDGVFERAALTPTTHKLYEVIFQAKEGELLNSLGIVEELGSHFPIEPGLGETETKNRRAFHTALLRATEAINQGLRLPRAEEPGSSLESGLSLEERFRLYQDDYLEKFESCEVRPEYKDKLVWWYRPRLIKHRLEYEAVSEATGGIPWYFIAAIHSMECQSRLGFHIHNGDPLTARTVRVPAGRPLHGTPPYDWKSSALDAFEYEGYKGSDDWSLANILFRLEQYNGFGYRPVGIPTPYLWAFSNHYSKGKYVSDGNFNPVAVSQQCGAALMLKDLEARKIIPPIPRGSTKPDAIQAVPVITALPVIAAGGEEFQLSTDTIFKPLAVEIPPPPSLDQGRIIVGHPGAESQSSFQRVLKKGQSSSLESILGDTDDRTRIHNTKVAPFRMICGLVIEIDPGFGMLKMRGTGWFAGPRTIITSAHCLFDPEYRTWVQKVSVAPGRDAEFEDVIADAGNEEFPFGQKISSKFAIHRLWKEGLLNGSNEDALPYDYGAIFLDEPFEHDLGWFSIKEVSDKSLISYNVNVCGYPLNLHKSAHKDYHGDPAKSQALPYQQYCHSGVVVDIDDHRIHYSVDTTGGQSGSPVFYYDSFRDTDPKVVGIHGHNERMYKAKKDFANGAPRMRPEVFDQIQEWIEIGNSGYYPT